MIRYCLQRILFYSMLQECSNVKICVTYSRHLIRFISKCHYMTRKTNNIWNNQSCVIVNMSKLMMLTTAVVLIILIANSTCIGFVSHSNKNEHDPQLQNAFAQALHPRQKPTTAFASEAIAPVLLAPIAISGNNVYIVWSSNKTGNYEIMFRASSDHGQTFGNKIDLSNSTSDSQNVDI